ncbi:hypothetical protein PV11_05989 [Exophiala sideris]|uniref:Uncharacterized protein n=1 Tax=Exophiala sideris TaxID=1016849 RepID=A0A0D1ZBB0_9EURO|nr:hypothetical protein PV11_05989 [Exophiala sideris]
MAQPPQHTSSTPADWPIGYPCIAQHAYRDENIDMPAGTRGKIVRTEMGYAQVTMPYLEPARSGFVPQSYLQIGTTRKYGDIHVEVPPTLVNSPTSAQSNIIWSKLSIPGTNRIFYDRAQVQIRPGPSNSKRITIVSEAEVPGQARGSLEVTIPSGVLGLDVGTWVHPVIEMMADGSPHSHSYTRLPIAGPYADWNQANSWALKIEFELDNGSWQHVYLSCSNPYEARTPQLNWPGAFDAYGHGIGIYRYLQQVQLDRHSKQAWMYDYGLARIKEQKFDFLTQTITPEDVLPPNKIVKASSMKTVGQMQAELGQLGLNAFGNPGQMDQPSRGTRRPAGACDSCYLHNLGGRNFHPDGVRKPFPSV